jgi:hypothetical protein
MLVRVLGEGINQFHPLLSKRFLLPPVMFVGPSYDKTRWRVLSADDSIRHDPPAFKQLKVILNANTGSVTW